MLNFSLRGPYTNPIFGKVNALIIDLTKAVIRFYIVTKSVQEF